MAYKVPAVITTCDYETAMDGDYWYVYLKSSGTFAFKYSKTKVDVFLQGGGGGGGNAVVVSENLFVHGGGGGAGGYQVTQYGQQISGSYVITIGEGGEAQRNGGVTSAFGFNAEGGEGANQRTAGSLGTAAGGVGGYYGGDGAGTSGGDGENGKQAFGVGGVFYGAGGGGSAASFGPRHGYGGETGGGDGGQNGFANTGSGGGGSGGKGGSGIIILRGTQDDQLPVKFDGVTLQSILYEGQEVMHLIHDGTQIFIERVMENARRWLGWLKQKTLSPQPVR